MDLDAAKITFVQESRELLEEMEKALLTMEQDGASDDLVNATFRAAHTIKGSAGLFGLDTIVRFTHNVESLLDQIRSGKQHMDEGKIALFLACGDHIHQLVDACMQESSLPDLDLEKRQALTERVNAYLTSSASKSLSVSSAIEVPVEALDTDLVSNDLWHISLRLAPDILQSGMDPLSFLRYLETLGKVIYVETICDGIPPFANMDPETLYLGFEIQFDSTADKQAIANVFEFVSDGSLIQILPPRSKIQQYLELIESLPEPEERLGEILLACKALTKEELARAIHVQKESTADPQAPLGQILVEHAASPSVVVAAALNKQQQARDKKAQETRHLKVDVAKLDTLINLVGELVIATASAELSVRREKAHDSEEIINHLASLVESIRDTSLGLRMVPIGEVFQRFPRVVRDVSKELEKKIDLAIAGAETEVDKSMVEKITDPLMHIIRNSMDHGIESPETRKAIGKPEAGTIKLNAYHDAGSIVIEVEDDGAGINLERVKNKAIEKGLITADQILSNKEIINLVFEPGFSTAEKVTNLSGRGVGMDVVRRNIEALRGEVDLDSTEGIGSRIRIRLPLTLAIIDGFQVRVGDLSYVVPLDLVQECADLAEGSVQRNIVRLRGEALPFFRLRDMFEIPGTRPLRESLLVAQYGANRVGLVVDQLEGASQAVIKPLGDLFAQMKGLVGTTILGNGNVAMILDVPYLSQISTAKMSLQYLEEKKIA